MLEELRTIATNWLPLFQALGAVASVLGAILSWRFALRAEKAQREMTRNVVQSQTATTLERVKGDLRVFVAAVSESGPDQVYARFKSKAHEVRPILDDARATLKAASAYLLPNAPSTTPTMSAVDAALKSTAGLSDVEAAARAISATLEELRIAAATRAVAPNT